jgi:membrane-bound serine protease (ClpP class)
MNLLDPLGWAVVLLTVGCGFLVLEVFIPSGGLLGFFAAVSLISALVMAYRRDLTTGLSFTVIALAVAPAVLGLALKYWPKTPMGKAFLGELPTEAELKLDDPRRRLLGRVGVAQSKMLPSGAVLIDGQLIDAVSQGLAIDPGDPVVVVEVSANRVVVRPAQRDEAEAANLSVDDPLARPIEDFGLESMDDPLT